MKQRERIKNNDGYKRRGREHYHKNIEVNRIKSLEAWRRRVAKNHEIIAVMNHRRRARLINAPGTHTAADIRALYDEQQGQCSYCGIRLFDDYHVDHVQPISRGGSNGVENLLLACPECNLSKNDKTLDEWKAVRGW